MNRLLFPALLLLPLAAGGAWLLLAGNRTTDAAAFSTTPKFSAPIACDDPATCLVQNHFDLAKGSDVADASCGARTYDEHHGVDFRILDLPTMAKGVPVTASADGVVKRARDGEYDGAWIAQGRNAIGVKECGNGVLVDHGEGYETFYCHLRRGSIAVEEGQEVKRGERLADVGMSGRAEFPHVHFAVFKDGERVDPFTGRSSGEGCGEGESLWAAPVPAHWSADAGPFVYKAGFTERRVDLPLIERGLPKPATDSAALVFYARAIWLDEGDVQRIQLEGPEGFEPVGMEDDPLESSKAQAMRFVGRPLKGERFPPGVYNGRYQVVRNGAVVLDYEQSFELN